MPGGFCSRDQQHDGSGHSAEAICGAIGVKECANQSQDENAGAIYEDVRREETRDESPDYCAEYRADEAL